MIRVSVAAVAAVVAFVPAVAAAGDLVPDGQQQTDPNADPNGPPPMPPPFPAPGQPGSVAPPPPPGSTAAQLEAGGQNDDGLGLKLFYVQPEIGFGWASLGGAIPTPAIATQDYSQYRTGAGPAFGLGAGLEFVTFQVGGRVRALTTSNFNLWNAGGELAIQPGSGRFWPRFGVSVGYAWAAKWNPDLCGAACDLLDVSGLSLGARAGFQYFVTKIVEVGLDATADALFLKRESIGQHPVFGEEGSGTGVALAGLAHLGVQLP